MKVNAVKIKKEQNLKWTESQLKDFVNIMADLAWEVDSESKYSFCSENVIDILGYKTDEMLGKTPFDFMPDDEAKRVAEIFAEIVKKKEPFKDLENWNVHKKGYKICLSTSGVPIFNNKKELIGYRGVDKDITEHKQGNEVLIESEKRFKKFFNEMPDAIFLTQIGGKNQGEILDVNPAAEKQTGYPRNELIGKNIITLLAAEEVDSAISNQRELDLGKQESIQFVEKKRRKNGSTYWTEVLITEIEIHDEKISLSVNRDITQLKNSEDKLKISVEEAKIAKEEAEQSSNFLEKANQKSKELMRQEQS